MVLLIIGLLLSWRVELNTFSLNHFYRNRIVRCYLGATRWRPGMRKPNRFTGFDGADDIYLDDLQVVPKRPDRSAHVPLHNSPVTRISADRSPSSTAL